MSERAEEGEGRKVELRVGMAEQECADIWIGGQMDRGRTVAKPKVEILCCLAGEGRDAEKAG